MNNTIQEFRDKFPRLYKVSCWGETCSNTNCEKDIENFWLEKMKKEYDKGFNDGAEITGRTAEETHAIEMKEQKEELRKKIAGMEIENAEIEGHNLLARMDLLDSGLPEIAKEVNNQIIRKILKLL